MKTDILVELLLKDLTGTISAEEQAMLKVWLDEDDANQELYSHLHDREEMASDYQKWAMIDPDKALRNMERRISEHRLNPHLLTSAIISTMSIAVALAAILLPRRDIAPLPAEPAKDYIETIIPGHTMATLTQPDGNSFNLINEDIPVKPVSEPKKKKAETEDAALAAIAMNNLKVPRGGEFHIILEDSTEVWLNAESSLEYPETFDEHERCVAVTGEAYFKVRKDDRPFYVTSYGQVVKVYGTEFNVCSYPDDSFVYTTLVDGKVGVLPDKESTSILYLNPDHQSIFSKGDGVTTVNQVNSKVVTSWKDGQFVFEDQTLEQIMVKLSRWYDFEYRFADREVAAIQFKGRIPRYGKFGDMLEILEKSGGILFKAEGNCIVISKKS